MINLRQEVFYSWSKGARGGHFPCAQEGNVEMLRESTIPPIKWVGEYLNVSQSGNNLSWKLACKCSTEWLGKEISEMKVGGDFMVVLVARKLIEQALYSNEHLEQEWNSPTIPASLLGPKKVPTGDR